MRLIKNVIKKRKITFEMATEEWLILKKKAVKESTYSNYRYTIKRYLFPQLGKLTIKSLESYNFNSLIDKLSKSHSPKTVRDIIAKLKSILFYVQDEYGVKIKMNTIIVPQLNQEPLIILSKRETTKLEEYCIKENSIKSIGILVCLKTGLRIGELCALSWKDIDLEKREITVRKTLQRIYDEQTGKTKIIVDTPKSKNSVRNIPISNKLYGIMKNLKKGKNANDYFIKGDYRQYIEPRCFENIYKDILKKARIREKYNFHILRHTFATNCIEAGMDVKTLSELLGHSGVEITLNKYVHSSYNTKKKYLERL